ncbi:hypothetical protein [Candidatus Palauibacter sp.]|uniref:hypothetical protein n=1 Tax=Candidatus Palauibacter sp. TaxID=3101350 RepID=UPI003B01C2B1
MIRIIRATLSVAALAMFLFIASSLALPQHAEAQMDCVGCMYAGDDPREDLGIGQPGAGWDCGSQPDGASECNVGADYDAEAREWISWCEEGGSGCQSLMFLDFTQDGMASWGTANDDKQATSTCDGVLLRGSAEDDASLGSDIVLMLVL